MTKDASGLPDFDSFEWEDGEEQDARSLFDSATPLDNLSLAAESDSLPEDIPQWSGEAPVGGWGGTSSPVQDNQPSRDTEEGFIEDAASLDDAILIGVDEAPPRSPRRSARREIDPFFISWLLLALSLGLSSMGVIHPIGRYAFLWTLLALVGAVIIAFQTDVVTLKISLLDLFWGVGWGAAVGLPLLLVGADLLAEASVHIFPAIPDGAVFLFIVFVLAPTETVFFRYLVQAVQPVMLGALVASGWSILLFFPTMDVVQYPFVALIVGTFLVMLNMLYGYVRQRNGLAAAWLCQTLVSLGWLFIPRLLV